MVYIPICLIYPTVYRCLYLCLYVYVFFLLIYFVLLSSVARLLLSSYYNIIFFLQICTFLPFIRLALIISGDIESNPGPENLCNQNLSLCHWNLNGIAANNFIKISLLEAYNTIHNFDLICISDSATQAYFF